MRLSVQRIQRWWRRHLRHKAVNKRDPITLEDPRTATFKLKLVNEFVVHMFDAESLWDYILATGKAENPLTRRPLNHVELTRLARLLGVDDYRHQLQLSQQRIAREHQCQRIIRVRMSDFDEQILTIHDVIRNMLPEGRCGGIPHLGGWLHIVRLHLHQLSAYGLALQTMDPTTARDCVNRAAAVFQESRRAVATHFSNYQLSTLVVRLLDQLIRMCRLYVARLDSAIEIDFEIDANTGQLRLEDRDVFALYTQLCQDAGFFQP